MTQAELAKALAEKVEHPIPVSSIGRIESGDRRVEVDDLMALAIALGVTPISLLLPQARSPRDAVELTGWGRVDAGWAWGYALGTRDLVDVVTLDANGRIQQPLAARSFPIWAEEDLRTFYGEHPATS